MNKFPHLFEPLSVRDVTLKNRIAFGSHATGLSRGGRVTDELIAYHQARAAGGVGLILLEGATVHPTYAYPEHFLYLGTDDSLAGLQRLVRAIKQYETVVIGQLFHAGRAVRLSLDGSRPVSYGPSEVTDDRYRRVPRPFDTEQLAELIQAHGDAAARLTEAGADGVEVLAGMGYLFSQFLNPRVNRRDDEFGGSFENRLRLLRETLLEIRRRIGEAGILGVRLSGDELDEQGLNENEVLAVCQALNKLGAIDYLNITAGFSGSPAGWARIFPPMAIEPAFVAEQSARIRSAVDVPVFVGGRINQPHAAEQILATGQADLCSLVRALIADSEFVNKARAGDGDAIRACIACNQACVGHRHAHFSVSCIQNPPSGRETQYPKLTPVKTPKKVVVIGGGPAGMKAAAVAAERGHHVMLYEQATQLGGQAIAARALPRREEFGGLITNLEYELRHQQIAINLGTCVDRKLIDDLQPDIVIVATGAKFVVPQFEGVDETPWMRALDVIDTPSCAGQSVVIADYRCEWTGLGVAELLARQGCAVRLVVNGSIAGEMLEVSVRDHWLGELDRLGIEIINFARLFGGDQDTAYFKHTLNGEAIVLSNMDTLVVINHPQRQAALETELQELPSSVYWIGDCFSPRTAEEAILDAFKVASQI